MARPKGRGNRNATTATSEKAIEIYFASADAKVCDAGACFLPERAENAAGGGWEMVRRFECGGLFAVVGGKCGGEGLFAAVRQLMRQGKGRKAVKAER